MKNQKNAPGCFVLVFSLSFLFLFCYFFFSGDSGIPDLHFSLEKNKKDDEETKKKRKRKKENKNKLRQSALHICVFKVSNKCSLAETRKGRQKWTDALLEAI